jgi:hypothetical protein
MPKDINQLIKQTIQAYKIKPINIIADFNREIAIKNDYQGRQVFELMQNADDQFIDENKCDVKVRIETVGNKFIIQNSGIPFDINGIESLMNPYSSPKKLRVNTIGHNGKGFRSVLNWSNSLRIITHKFAVEFSKEYADDKVQELLKDESILSQIADRIDKNIVPAAILSFPKELGEQVINEGYSTRIELSLFPNVVEKIKDEINTLDFRELLFLKHIKTVIININNEPERIIERIAINKTIRITEIINNIKKESIWSVNDKHDVIDNKNYEFVIAYSDVPDIQNELRDKGVLYSFFKTDLQMPFPFVVHATLDLTSDRNGLQKQSDYNQKIINELIRFIGETAKMIAENSERIDYQPMKLLLPKNNVDIVLENNFNFSRKLAELINELKIFPTIENKYISFADNPKYCDLRFDNIVIATTFDKLLKHCDDEIVVKYLRNRISFYTENETAELIDQNADEYTNKEKITIIELFIRKFEKYPNSLTFVPKILCDYYGNRITDDSRIFNNPTKHFELPKQNWAKLKFISPEFEEKLASKFGIVKSDLYQRFAKFNVLQYSFDNILRQLINQAGDDRNNIIEFLRWLFNYWVLNNNQFETALTSIDIKVISRSGKVIKCNECYFGKEYNNNIGESILTAIGAEFLCSSELFSFDNNIEIELLIKFFTQIGIRKYPRIYCKQLSPDERDSYLSANRTIYPTLYDRYGEKNIFTDLYLDNATLRVDYVDNIKQVLENVDMNAILSWILSDYKIQNILTSQNELEDTSILICGVYKKQYQRNFYKKYLISYLRMIFQNEKWLMTKAGNKVNVNNCTIEDTKLSPIIETISINYDKLSKNLGRPIKKEIELFFEKFGVAQSFTELSKEKIYEIFLEIPKEKNIGKLVCRSAYNQFNLAFDASEIENNITNNNIKYNEFKKNGQVLCSHNGELVYRSASTVYYANNKVYSDEILNKYPILAINRRQGEAKICKAFCVKSIKEIGKIKVTPNFHCLNDEFQAEYKLLLPYIYAKRIGKDKQKKELRELQNSKVMLVVTADTECKIDNEIVKGELHDYELIQAKSEHAAYIKIPQNITSIKQLRKDLRFCETLSELFTVFLNVESDKSFFSQLIGASNSDRDFLYKSDGDINLSTLNLAKEYFIQDLNYKEEFWNALARALGMDEMEFNYIEYLQIIQDSFDYKDLCKNKQSECIIELFKKIKIDVCDYNQTAYQQIYLQEYYKRLYDDIKTKYVNSKEEKSHECWRLDIPNFENSVDVNVEKIFIKQLESLAQTKQEQVINLDNVITSQNDENRTLIDDTQSIEEIKKRIEQTNVLGIQKVDITKTDTSTIAIKTGTENRQRSGIVDNKQRETIGFIGELKVYHELKQMLVNNEIKYLEWISGNAVKNGTIEKDDAKEGAGYDFRISVDGITKTFIEVKASSQNGIVFDISKNEIDFAKENKEIYHIYFVSIKDGVPIIIQDLGCIFDFDEEEDFFSNKNFTVEEKSFTVKAKINT